MYLKALTIRGFKSFARKTVLEFQPGITIIVGPNGSGKSNIADAVMWVLGEQSPLTLRGNRMEDVIFSGSASLKPVNMAEVALSLDNSNNDFPLEYSEINLSRNVVRGGDSEYRLNNSSCRLLDIQELLSDAGVGRSLNSVVSQGNLDEVLTCTDEQRRDYIEEAGGLLKYRKRRERAERKLIRMDEELTHTNAILREVRRQLRPLQQQAGRLERYQTLSLELKEIKLKLDITRLRAMHQEWSDYEKAQREQENKLKEIEGILSGKLEDAREIDSSEKDWRTGEAGKRDGFYKLVSLHEQLKATFDLWDQKRQAADAVDRRKVEESLTEVQRRKLRAEGRIEELTRKAEEVESKRSSLQEKERELKGKVDDTVRRIAGIEARLDVYRNPEIDVSGIDSSRGPRMKLELEELESENARLQEEATRLQESVKSHSAAVISLEGEIEKLRDARSRIIEQRNEIQIKQTYVAATLELLSNLDTNSWGTLNTTVALLKDDPTSGGLGGMLIESLRINPKYEEAIMGYLGPWVFGLIAKDDDSITTAVKYLKRNNLGQSLFFKYVPVEHHDDPEAEQEENDHHSAEEVKEADDNMEEVKVVSDNRLYPEGCLRARELVQAPEWFESALGILLDDVVVIDDLDKAFKIIDRYPDLVFLTPEGDVISSGTMIKGGSPEVRETYLQASQNRREGLEESFARCISELEANSLNLYSCEEELSRVSGDLRGARSEIKEENARVLENSKLFASCTAKIEWIEKELESSGEEYRALVEANEDTGVLEQELGKLRNEETEMSGGQQQLAAEFQNISIEERTIYSELIPLKEELQALQEKEKDIASIISNWTGVGFALAVEKEDFDDMIRCHKRLLDLLDIHRKKIKAELDRGSEGAREAYSRLHELQDEIIELQRRHESLRDEIHKEELSRAELKIKVEQLVSSVVDGHKVPLEFALKQYSVEEPEIELENRAGKLCDDLERLGPVNPEAITEKDALEERHGFLKEQLDDIEKAKKELRRVITDIDREIESKFASTLEDTNKHFMTIFSILFPNGKAELKLTNPEDILNSGIEILAQPEGKKLRRISLLSGGEMSLTALAFFFALFKVRPSPFYFLDEVEAALDDVNLYRFLELVKQFKDESQLILVTHQKRSMEIADILYGVTMQEDGVSQVISQKVAV